MSWNLHVNSVGTAQASVWLGELAPALLMNFLPHFSRPERAVFTNLSARVGTFIDNRLYSAAEDLARGLWRRDEV